jgi:hypothetical protein
MNDCHKWRLTADFSSRQGAKAQEYRVYFKLLQRRIGEKDPSAEALALCVGVWFPKVLLSLCAGAVEAPLFYFI